MPTNRYPRHTWQPYSVAERCSICERAADLEVHGDVTADSFPLFFCDTCKAEYYADADGAPRPHARGIQTFRMRPTSADAPPLCTTLLAPRGNDV